MLKHNLRIFIPVLISATLFTLSVPNILFPSGSAILGLFCLSPILLSLYRSRKTKTVMIQGFMYGIITTISCNYWLLFFQDFSLWTLLGVSLVNLAYSGFLFLVLQHCSKVPSRYRPSVIAIIWVTYEFLKSSGYLAYPSGLLAYPFHSILPVIQFIDITGIWGLSFFIALINSTIAEWLYYLTNSNNLFVARKRSHLPLHDSLVIVFLTILAITYGYNRLGEEKIVKGEIDIVLVQHNSNPWLSSPVANTLSTLQRLTLEGINQNPKLPDLIVWSETALRFPPTEKYKKYYSKTPEDYPFLDFLSELPVPLLTGTPWIVNDDPIEAMNASVLLSSQGEVLIFYGKQHLVPFAESIPFWEVAFIQKFFREIIGLQAVWTANNEPKVFSLVTKDKVKINFSTPICFEDMFPNINRKFVSMGADLLINLTNDAWSQTRSAEVQHFVAAKFRAIENRKPLVRGTNGGVTTAIDPWGRIIGNKIAPLFEEYALRVVVPFYGTNNSPYTKYGDYFPTILLILSMVIILRDYFSKFFHWKKS